MTGSSKPEWTFPADIKQSLKRLWQRGDLLSQEITFPFRIRIRAPRSAEVTAGFDSVRRWVQAWQTLQKSVFVDSVQVEWESWTHRVFGINEKPVAVVFPDCMSVLRTLNVQKEWNVFQNMIAQTRQESPALLSWIKQHPTQALELALSDIWNRLLAVVKWIRLHPQSRLYLRQINIPKVDTKFIERHRRVLAELLDIVLAPDAICSEETGVAAFTRRYGFRDRPERIRFRFLDRRCAIEEERLGLDLTLRADAFAGLCPAVEKVFITENEINFLSFPNHSQSLVIFGSGYGWSVLRAASWLQACKVYYWGDIDTHGFAILDQLRAHLPHVRSFLMNLETLLAFPEWHVNEPKPASGILTHLTPQETETFDYLRNHPGLRLEQERIPFSRLETTLQKL